VDIASCLRGIGEELKTPVSSREHKSVLPGDYFGWKRLLLMGFQMILSYANDPENSLHAD